MQKGAQQLGLALSAQQISSISDFLSDLQEFNEHTNLVSNADPERVVREHVLDALSLVALIPDVEGRIKLVDIGSGAGFPALVLSIMFPQMHAVLIDSIGKKTKFLMKAAEALGLNARVEVLNARAEDVAHQRQYREQFDVATARAVGKLDLVAELTLPFLKSGGVLLAQKSSSQLETELEPAQVPIEKLGGIVDAILPVDKKVIEKDFVVVKITKQSSTPSRYPRPAAQLKTPLS